MIIPPAIVLIALIILVTPSNPGFDSDSDSGACSDTHCLHTLPAVFGYADSHTEPALLASALTENP